MEPASDGELLQQYARERSEEAFREIVRRHIDWVYSSAVRQLRDTHLAEDITQSVFILLARKARTFDRNVVLSAWLFRALRYLSADAMKSKWRRRHHERELGAVMQAMRENASAEWNEIAPALDAAVARLRSTDRRAILLRFFERKSHQEVGAALGISEDAAKMRVSRAVEKLRTMLARRGVVLPATALLAVMTAHTVSAAPATLSTASIAAATGTSVSATASLPWIKGVLLAMSTGKQTAVAIGVLLALLLGGGVTAYLLKTPAHAEAMAAADGKRPEPEQAILSDDMRARYALADNEIVKRVPPPFLKSRDPYMRKLTMGDNLKVSDPDGTSLVFKWDPKEKDPLSVWSFRLGDPDLQFAMWGILDAGEDIDAPEKLRRYSLPGDWIFRPDAAPKDRALALCTLLRDQFNLVVTIERKKAPLEVITIAGELVPPATPVQIYSDKMTDNKPGPGTKNDLAHLASTLRLLLRRPVLNESTTPPKTPLAICFHTSAMVGQMPPKRMAAKIDMILANVSRQTGLQLKREVRPIDAWVVREIGEKK